MQSAEADCYHGQAEEDKVIVQIGPTDIGRVKRRDVGGARGNVTCVDDSVEGIDDGGNWEIYEPMSDELQYGGN